MVDHDYLIPSRKHRPDGAVRPIGKVQAYKVIREAGEDNRVWGLGTHSMRKTFGYHYYKMTGDIVTLMKILNHCDPAVTLRYIGIEEEEIKQSLKHFNLFKKEDLVAEKPDKMAKKILAHKKSPQKMIV